MGLMEGRKRSGGGGKIRAFCASAVSLIGLILVAAPLPALAIELSAPQEALYSTVSIYPPHSSPLPIKKSRKNYSSGFTMPIAAA